MIDTTLVLVEHLSRSGTTLKQLVGERIFVGRPPENYTNSQPALVLFCRGGMTDKRIPVLTPSYQFKCFGGSSLMKDAKQVYLALHDALHGMSMKASNAGMIMSAHEETMGQELFDPDTDWPFVLVFYSLNVKPL